MALDCNEFEKDVVYIDSRERERGYRFEDFILDRVKTKKGQDFLVVDGKEHPFNGVKRCDLLVGDYAFNHVIFEYKTVHDFWISNQNNHIITQLWDLITKSQYYNIEPNFIIEGDPIGYFQQKDRTKGIDRVDWFNLNHYENCFFSIAEWMPTFPRSTEEGAFYSMAKRFAESGLMSGPTARHLSKDYDFTAKMIKCCTPLTWKQAIAVKNFYNLTSPIQIFDLNIAQLSNVKTKNGRKVISEKTARECYNVLHGYKINRE